MDYRGIHPLREQPATLLLPHGSCDLKRRPRIRYHNCVNPEKIIQSKNSMD